MPFLYRNQLYYKKFGWFVFMVSKKLRPRLKLSKNLIG